MSDKHQLFALFGGLTATAQAIGRDKALLSRWEGVPWKYNAAILAAARERDLPLADVRACLDNRCPTCGRAFRNGHRHE